MNDGRGCGCRCARCGGDGGGGGGGDCRVAVDRRRRRRRLARRMMAVAHLDELRVAAAIVACHRRVLLAHFAQIMRALRGELRVVVCRHRLDGVIQAEAFERLDNVEKCVLQNS